jgi:hypothetical protein
MLKIPSSVTVVVPAWEISRLLDIPYFKETREKRERQYGKETKTIPVPE